jgi:fibronectin-binding autotransporter adhesin
MNLHLPTKMRTYLHLIPLLACASLAPAAQIERADNTTALNSSGAWSGGSVPGSSDIAVWGSALTTSKANAIGTNLSFSGIKIDTSNAGVTTNTVNATTGSTLTLGADGINITASSTSLLWMRAALALGAAQTWSVATNKQLTLGSATISGANNLTISGGGTLVHANTNANFGIGTLTLQDIRVTSDTTARTISNNIILNGDIGAGSTAFVAGLNLAGNISLTGSGTRTISVQNSSGADTNTALTLGSASKTISGEAALALVNGNPGGAIRVGLVGNSLIDTDLIIGTNVTTIMGTGTTNPFTTNSAVQVDGRMRLGNGTTTGGNFTINSLSGSGLVDSGQGSGNSIGTLTIGGGSGTNEFTGIIENGSFGRTAVVKSGSNTQIFSGNNRYTETTTVSGGALIINGDQTAAIGVLNVGASGTLGGSGTIGGATGIAGTLSPGNSPGTITFANNLTMSNGSTLVFEAGDLVNVSGVLDLDNAWKLTLVASGDWQLGGSTVLFDYGSLAASPFLTPVITDNTGLFGTLSVNNRDGMIWLDGLSVVPEPSTYALLGLGGLALAAYRLRRRRRAR